MWSEFQFSTDSLNVIKANNKLSTVLSRNHKHPRQDHPSLPFLKWKLIRTNPVVWCSNSTLSSGTSDQATHWQQWRGHEVDSPLNVTLYVLFEEWVWRLHLAHLSARLVVSDVPALFNKAEGSWGSRAIPTGVGNLILNDTISVCKPQKRVFNQVTGNLKVYLCLCNPVSHQCTSWKCVTLNEEPALVITPPTPRAFHLQKCITLLKTRPCQYARVTLCHNLNFWSSSFTYQKKKKFHQLNMWLSSLKTCPRTGSYAVCYMHITWHVLWSGAWNSFRK